MSTFLDLDSSLRDFRTYKNSCSYVVTDDKVADWSAAPRNVASVSTRQGLRVVDYAQSVQVKHLILPFGEATYTTPPDSTPVAIHTGNIQRLYLDVHSTDYNDSNLINTLNPNLRQARFVLTLERIQFNHTGNTGLWVHFGCRMDQVIRFSRNRSVVFKIIYPTGGELSILDPALPNAITPALQTYLLLELTPYFRDADYANQGVGLVRF